MPLICPSIVCTNVSDLAPCPPIFATQQVSVLITSLPGCVVPVGVLPKVFTFQPGDIPPVQVCLVSSGSPIALALQGCQSMITRSLKAGSTQADIVAAVASMQTEWVTQQATCEVKSQLNVQCGFFTNDAQVYLCPNGTNPKGNAVVGGSTLQIIPGGGVQLIIQNDRDTTIIGSDFQMIFSNGGIVNGSVNIPPHTTFQEWDTVTGNPVPSWCIYYQGAILTFPNGCGPDTAFKYILTVAMLNPFTGGGGVSIIAGRVMVPAGTCAGATKAEANAAALKLLNETVAANLAAGTLTCV